MLSAMSSVPERQKAGAAPSTKGQHMGRPPFPDYSGKSPPGARRALRRRNWRIAKTATYSPCVAPPARITKPEADFPWQSDVIQQGQPYPPSSVYSHIRATAALFLSAPQRLS